MGGRKPREMWFQGAQKFYDLINQIEIFLRQITPQNRLYYFSKKILVLGALWRGIVTKTLLIDLNYAWT